MLLLDPRCSAEAVENPIIHSVNIPLEEMQARTYELPPRNETVYIAGREEVASAAKVVLEELGRKAEIATDWSYGPGSAGRLWEPNGFLKQMLPELQTGSALDLACGTGRDSVYMAAHGWEVTGIDWLPDAIEKARTLSSRYGLSLAFSIKDIERQDFAPPEQYDLISCAFFLHRPMVAQMHEWLKPGGAIIYETFTVKHREQFGKPSSDAHVLEADELRTCFSDFNIVRYEEGWRDGRHTARLFAIRK